MSIAVGLQRSLADFHDVELQPAITEVRGFKYKDMVAVKDSRLRDLLLQVSRSSKCVKPPERREYQQSVSLPPLNAQEYDEMLASCRANAPWLEQALMIGDFNGFNCKTANSTQKEAIYCRVMRAVAAKGLAYSLVNLPHLVGPVFAQLAAGGLYACIHCPVHY